MTLLPELESQLLAAARRPQAAPAPRRLARPDRPWRRSGRFGLFALVGALAVGGGGAYAAKALLWDPPLGTPRAGHARATTAPPPATQLSALEVLRRPQTAADRDATSLAALRVFGTRWQGQVRTAYVRRLATLPGGLVAVLVPIESPAAPGKFGDRFAGPRLCVWIGHPGVAEDSGGGCSDTASLLGSAFALRTGIQSATSKRLGTQLDRYYAAHGRPHAGDGPSVTVSRIQARQRRELRNQRSITIWLVKDGGQLSRSSTNARRAAVKLGPNIWFAQSRMVDGRFGWIYPPRTP